MRSNHLKILINCLILSAILIANVRAQRYGNYNNYARQQYYQFPQPQKPTAQLYLASAPAPPASQPSFNLNARQNYDSITQIVQGSEQFTFDMIYVS